MYFALNALKSKAFHVVNLTIFCSKWYNRSGFNAKAERSCLILKKLISLFVILAIILSCCGAGADIVSATSTDPNANRNIKIQPAGVNPWPTDGTSPTTGRNFADLEDQLEEGFGGMTLTGEYYPIMVQHCGYAGGVGIAAPFYGSYADVYYEMAKSQTGHTRMCMVFNDFLPTYAGGSRSMRVGYLYIRQEWNCPLLFHGRQNADGPTDVTKAAAALGIPSSLGSGVGTTIPWSEIMLFDSLAGSKKWLAYKYRVLNRDDECNVIWDLPGIRNNLLGERSYEDHNHTWKFGELPEGGDNAETVYVLFKNNAAKQLDEGKKLYFYYNSMYQYDEDENVYYRYMMDELENPDNNAHLFEEQIITAATIKRSNRNGESQGCTMDAIISYGEPITFANVIVQYIDMSWNYGGERPLPTLLGTGNADYFMGGKHYVGVWNREKYDDRTVFYGEDGQEIALQPGRTMIVMMDYKTANREVKFE